MNNIYRGELVSQSNFLDQINQMKSTINKDLLSEKLDIEIVINALDRLGTEIKIEEIKNKMIHLGIQKWEIEEYIQEFIKHLQKDEILKKVKRELGEDPFSWNSIDKNILEKRVPIGVLMHIGAGNALGLSAFSVIEGLLTGNINILKLPQHEGGISVDILNRLVEIEPKLKPYLYVIDISSQNQSVIKQLINIVDAVVVWGNDDTIHSIRQLVPPHISLVEYGHRISFAYFTKRYHDKDLKGLANEIVTTDQLYCSSPQCVFYETDDREELELFAWKLSKELNQLSIQLPTIKHPMDVQSQITLTKELVKMESLLKEKKLVSEDESRYCVMIDYKPKLKPSPLFRNIWVMPISRSEMIDIVRDQKGHLQTVGLSCSDEEFDELSHLFYATGINRIMPCDKMSSNYSGEPHDGMYPLLRYTRKVNRFRV